MAHTLEIFQSIVLVPEDSCNIFSLCHQLIGYAGNPQEYQCLYSTAAL